MADSVNKATRGYGPIPSAQGQRGFTLVELLVVVFIIGVLVGAVALSPAVVSTTRPAQEQAERLQLLFAQIRDRALMENREYGFSIDASGASLWWYLPTESFSWSRFNEPPFQSAAPPKELSFSLQLASPAGYPDGGGSEQGGEKDKKPALVIFSDGQITPFRLHINAAGADRLTLASDGFSDVALQ